MEAMKELLGIFVAIILASVLAFCTSALIHAVAGKNYCDTMSVLYQDDYKLNWSLWTGCLIQAPGGQWVDAREYFRLEGIILSVIAGSK